MESIYDHNPTQAEIDNLTYGAPKKQYLAKDNADLLTADIAILYADRGDKAKSQEYWNKIPDLYQEWKLGLDSVSIPVD